MSFPAMPRIFRDNGRRQTSELRRFFDQLRIASADLKQASVELESQFLTTGSEMESLAGYGDQFFKQVQKLVGLATGNECDRSVFSDAVQLIERATHFLTNCQAKTDQMLDLLRDYNVQVEQLLGVEAELQRTMLPLQLVQILFRVESATLDPAVQQMFGSLTLEIQGLHAQVREIFGTKFKQLEQTHGAIGKVIGQLAQQSESLQKVILNQKAQIESTLEMLKTEMVSNVERDSRLGRLSRDLAAEMGQIVMALQCQDMVSQKLQHVTAALPAIETKFSEFCTAANPSAAVLPLQFMHQSCQLEAGQLAAAQAELSQAETTLQGGIQKVQAHLTEADSQSLSLDEFKLLTTSFNGMVQVLLEMIEEVRKLVAATVASAAEAYTMLQPLGSLASDLTAVVQDISTRIHLIGLNAQVQAARAARDNPGTALEVLSARTSDISSETNRISRQAALKLDSVAAGLSDSVKAFEKLRADGFAQQSLLDPKDCAEENQLHAFRDSALMALHAIAGSLEDIQRQAQQALASIQFTRFHQVTLPALRMPLVAIANTAEQLLQAQGCGIAQGSLLEGAQQGYTMASEREVFERVTSGNGPSSAAPAGPPPAPAAVIELFDDLPAEAAAKIVPMENPEEAVTLPPVAATGGAALGNNVELF
jgi:hypothetical protein